MDDVRASLTSYTIVRPEHLNHHGFLFGGQLLLWVDEIAWLAAARANPGCKLVTRAMDRIDFHASAPLGAILRFEARETRRGRTSLHYQVDVWADTPGGQNETLIFSTTVVFVNVDDQGKKIELCCVF